MNHIECAICNKPVHAIKIHLRDEHNDCSLAEYEERYPDAPLLSELAKQRIEQAMKERNEAKSAKKAKKKVDTIPEGKKPLSSLFGLGRIKGAKTLAGNEILIDVLQTEGFEDMIPDTDPNYVYDVKNLKTVLMGIQVNIPIYMYGHAGVGKSTLFEQVCARTNRRMVRVQHTVNTEESHIVGQFGVAHHKDEDTGQIVSVTEWMKGPLMMAMMHGWTYVADEYDRSHPSVLSCYQAVLEGKPLYTKEAPEEFRLIRPHENFRFVACGNTNGSGDETGLYQATVMQDAATFERFGIVVKQDYMQKRQEINIVKAQSGVTTEDATKIIDFAIKVRELHPNEISLTLGPRVCINIGIIGLMKANFIDAIEVAFANRLPESERDAVIKLAQRIFGDN